MLMAALVGAAALSANAGISFNVSVGVPVVVAPPVVAVTPVPPPPPVVVETVPPCPGVDYVWAAGYWSYRPTGYVWVRGRGAAARSISGAAIITTATITAVIVGERRPARRAPLAHNPWPLAPLPAGLDFLGFGGPRAFHQF